MAHAVRTGAPATTEAFPEGFWWYLAQHPDAGRVFNAAMQAKAQGAIAGILATYDFSGFRTIADIGGGHGHLLRAILDTVPTATGVLFELPHVIAEVAQLASERLTLHAGDFFRDALPTCDAYLLMEIIHDWGDEESVAILRAVRQAAAAPGAKVLVIEAIIPDDPGPAWAKMLDIHMLMLLGGRQRPAGVRGAPLPGGLRAAAGHRHGGGGCDPRGGGGVGRATVRHHGRRRGRSSSDSESTPPVRAGRR